MEITQNIQPLSCKQYSERLLKLYSVGDYRMHISLYILPNGDIIDCRYPKNIKHLGFTDMIYGNFADIKNADINNELGLNKSALSKYNVREFGLPIVKEALIRNAGVCAKNPEHKQIAEELKLFLADDDLLVHDLGYVKFLIMGRDNLYLTLPNFNINDKYAKPIQMDTVKYVASMCSINNYEDVIENSKFNNNKLSLVLKHTIGKGLHNSEDSELSR